MRRLFIIYAIMVAISSYAQDIIITNKAQKIDAKILEASASEIKYKKIDNIDGPIYTLHTDEINSIIYANGKVVLYNQPKIEEESDRELAQKQVEFVNNLLLGSTGTAGEEPADGTPCVPMPPLQIEEVNKCLNNFSGSTGTAGEEPAIGTADNGTVGRRAISMPEPEMNRVESGIVIVEVLLDQQGNVVTASIANGTTIADKGTLLSVLEAAKKAKFSEGYGEQVERITYRLELR